MEVIQVGEIFKLKSLRCRFFIGKPIIIDVISYVTRNKMSSIIFFW